MPTYRVLRPIEHNQVRYVPASVEDVLEKVPSAGGAYTVTKRVKNPDGSETEIRALLDVRTDNSGRITLTEAEAQAIIAGWGQEPGHAAIPYDPQSPQMGSAEARDGETGEKIVVPVRAFHPLSIEEETKRESAKRKPAAADEKKKK